MTIICFVVFPRAYRLARRMTGLLSGGGEAVANVDMLTSQQQLFFSLLLTAALIVSALL